MIYEMPGGSTAYTKIDITNPHCVFQSACVWGEKYVSGDGWGRGWSRYCMIPVPITKEQLSVTDDHMFVMKDTEQSFSV